MTLIKQNVRIDTTMNFDSLKEQGGKFDMFAGACLEAKKFTITSPVMHVIACRKAPDLAVKLVYTADGLHPHAL